MNLLSGNDSKLREFNEILGDNDRIQVLKGKDLREVEGTAREVIIYKSLDGGEGNIVEDTIVTIDGEEVVNIRWNIEALRNDIGKKIEFVVRLGYNTGEQIKIYKGVIAGVVSEPRGESGFGFDPFFLPNGESHTLAELAIQGRKNDFSARKIAVDKLLNDQVDEVVNKDEIVVWQGGYQ